MRAVRGRAGELRTFRSNQQGANQPKELQHTFSNLTKCVAIFLYFGSHCPNEPVFSLKGKRKVVSLPEQAGFPVKREKKSSFIARTSRFSR
ncbi:hypothetical protein [Neobacillus niacini]|uniref:hypothetical protein n=1 Tax=Neobacillus niacini TaxID=86668 RepID=UPI0028611064|nr:hypothetical protein [Neobacillus niacini]MDR7000372.1 hypothetical protein [Neobacillus niacini]